MLHLLSRKRIGIEALAVVAIGAATALAIILSLNTKGGHAQGATSQEPTADIMKFRDDLLSKPLAISPVLVHNMLTGKLDAMFGSELSGYQRNILQDGFITFEEYKSAEADWRTCMIHMGITMPEMVLNAMGRYNVEYSVSAELHATAEKARHDCDSKYTSEVSMAWADGTTPLTDKIAEVQTSLLVQCMASKGYSMKDADWKDGNREAQQAHTTCVSRAESATGVPVFLGGTPE